MDKAGNLILIEEASLELVPKSLQSHKSCRLVRERFGTPPELQILDDNYHHEIIATLSKHEKRGRPDVVHFALLDITSTPLFQSGNVDVTIRTVDNRAIHLQKSVRLPRTTVRFCGVMGKLLSNPESAELQLFKVENSQPFDELIESLEPCKAIALTRVGKKTSLREVVHKANQQTNQQRIVWIIGGFPAGRFSESVLKSSDELVSISERPLAAHVVTARLCYDIETELGVV